MPCICCDRSLCCFGATPCEWETGLVSRHVCMKYRYPPASWLPAASALLLGTALGADVSYLHVVLTASSPHVSNLGCTRPWEEVGEFFLRIALGLSAWDPMGQTVPWWDGGRIALAHTNPRGRVSILESQFPGSGRLELQVPRPGGRDGHRQGRFASSSTLPRETRHLSPHPINLLHREHPTLPRTWSHSSDRNDGTVLFPFLPLSLPA